MSTHAKLIVGLAISAAGCITHGTLAVAGHDHYLLTPNGKCHQVAAGQTGIDDPDHGGYHRYHANVHIGATESPVNGDHLGDGHGAAAVYKTGPAPEVCDGD